MHFCMKIFQRLFTCKFHQIIWSRGIFLILFAGCKSLDIGLNRIADNGLLCHGFHRSRVDYSLFTLRNNGSFMVLLVYVDNMILDLNDMCLVTRVKEFFNTYFQINDMGQLKYFLGIEVAHGDQNICLNQRNMPLSC